MRSRAWSAVIAGVWLASAAPAAPQDTKPAQGTKPAAITAMEKRAKTFTEPGSSHKLLERFLGKWETATRFYLFKQPTTAEKGTAEFSWLMRGRWLKCSWSGPFAGQPAEGFMLIGYDNFRQNYVTTSVTSLDTAMSRSAGDTDESGSLRLFGTIDEYMSGEPDRMRKQVWRFESADRIVLEVYDLALAENGSKEFDVTYVRMP